MTIKAGYILKAIKKLGVVSGLKLSYAAFFNRRVHVSPYEGSGAILVRGDRSDAELFFNIFVAEEYECNGDYERILDLGANVGYAAVYFAHHYPNAEISSYEPDEENARIAGLNTAAYRNIKVINKGVWWRNACLRVVNPEAESWALEFDETEGNGTEAVSIDDLVKGQKSIMVKMDIEGAEKKIFTNESRFFEKVNCLQIEIHDCWSEFFIWASRQSHSRVSLSGENIVIYK